MIRPMMIAAAISLQVAAAAAAQGLDFRIAGLGMASKNAADNTGTATSSDGTLGGFDVMLRLSGIGFGLRTQSGKFGSAGSQLALGEARLLLGSPAFSLEGAYIRRAHSGPLGTRSAAAVRAGARIELDVGATGLTVLANGGLYINAIGLPGQGKVSGWMVETGLRFQPRRLPLFVMLGYRSDAFSEAIATGTRTDNLGGVLLGGGVRLRR